MNPNYPSNLHGREKPMVRGRDMVRGRGKVRGRE